MSRCHAAVGVGLLIALAACATSVDLGGGVSRRGDHVYHYEGPELEATVGTRETRNALGEEWLVLALYLRSTSPEGNLTIDRKAVSVMTPDGHRLPLATQKEFRAAYAQIHALTGRAVFATSDPRTDPRALRSCDRWFFAEVGEGFATDELYLANFVPCSGPLVFNVPRGVQTGRWRLVIELEESRADIPFEIEERY